MLISQSQQISVALAIPGWPVLIVQSSSRIVTYHLENDVSMSNMFLEA